MKKQILPWQLWGFAFTSLGGTLLHFMYDWLGEAVWIAPFSGVNESTWEHMKLLFFPSFIFSIVQSFFFPDRRRFWCVKLRGILLGLALIPIFFYTYNGAVGRSPDWLNIAIFFLSAAVAYIYEARLLKREKKTCPIPAGVSVAILCAVAGLFIIFTFYPLTLGIFRDPLTDGYGIVR